MTRDTLVVAGLLLVIVAVFAGFTWLSISIRRECDRACAPYHAIETHPTHEGMCDCVLVDRSVKIVAP